MPHSNRITGNKGEALAAEYLAQNGFEIIERNWRFKYWEVDLIAGKGNRLHFFEIKTRTSRVYGLPEESVSTKKMANLKNIAEEYQFLHPEWKYIQFNVLAIIISPNEPVDFFLIEDVYF